MYDRNSKFVKSWILTSQLKKNCTQFHLCYLQRSSEIAIKEEYENLFFISQEKEIVLPFQNAKMKR